MTEEFKTSKPIYSQIADRIIQQFVRGEIRPGEKLPSVREMAIQSGVNPNTIQRTYGELERMGVVESRRGQGTFMTEQIEMRNQLRADIQRDIVAAFIENMRGIGLEDREIAYAVEQFLVKREEDK
ncbi:GntR family transcriptional regulator [Bacillus thermotolerans]|uniref:Transcriptional regulator, GntR family n=1 Tax=Bacillus thermotolerans TaxID=1221996 RepID=A0A0F5HTJ2_BACTR|nr:GntR family transcriptional regulator [Bacillus thermotolerans]KKB36360.1 Transcriptional regulator, GntR family [Bacillus thermotolerans]KKB43135.1 Transcriptional regulator, GntR family [Bacillus thermotolerans]KKB43537.1 Transcriptional regulator, GntR family [Bacillus thermotolerans]